MATIVPFPAKPEENYSEVEKLIRKWLSEMSTDHRFIDSITDRMMYFIEKYASQFFEPTFNLAVPPNMSKEAAEALLKSIEKGVDETAEQVQEMVNRIIIERLSLEVEIYKMRDSERKKPLNLS